MKQRRLKRFLLISLLLYAVIVLVRESGTYDLFWMKSSHTLNTTLNWNDNNLAFDAAMPAGSGMTHQLSDVPVIVMYREDTLYSDYQEDAGVAPLYVFINELPDFPLWVPLVKYVNAEINTDISYYGDWTEKRNGSYKKMKYQVHGYCRQQLKFSVVGLCSCRHAKNKLKQVIAADIAQQVREHLDKQ